MNIIIDDLLPYGCLRKLQPEDTLGMLEWMRDEEISSMFLKDFASMNEEEALRFINDAYRDLSSLHVAIAGEGGEYLGTASLKNIDQHNRNAEYAISTRKKAHGSGIARRATENILRLGFERLELHRIYLNVKSSNERAISFYRKMGFVEEGIFRQHIFENGSYCDLFWFSMLSDEFFASL